MGRDLHHEVIVIADASAGSGAATVLTCVRAGMGMVLAAWSGRIGTVFANAGYGVFSQVAATSDKLVRDLFKTNFFGTLRCIRKALLRMLAGL